MDDAATTDEDSVATLDVLANDSDGDGDPLSVAAVDTTGTLGSVAINPDNSVTYDPGAAFQALPAGASADDSFTYTADDGQGGTAVATVALTVTGVNDAPAAVDDGGFSTAFDTPLSIAAADLLANDSDPDGDPLSVTAVSDPLNGSVALDPQGDPLFTPEPGFSGAAGFTYTAADGQGGTAQALVSLDVEGPPAATGVSLWSPSVTPVTASDDDPNAVELGVKFQADVDGLITGLRFYKGAANTGTHLGNLWTVDGTNLASATFTNETGSGWQQVDLAAPVAIAADTTYVASYFAPNGGYAFDGNYFTSAFTNGPLTALASDSSGGNGVYQYSATSTFPDQTFNNNNYWVDVVFEPDAGPVNTPPVAVDDGGFSTAFDTPLSIAAAALLANDSDPDGDPLSVTAVSDPLNGSVALDPQGDPLFTPEPGFSGAAGFTYTAADGNGGTAQARASLTVDVFSGQLAA